MSGSGRPTGPVKQLSLQQLGQPRRRHGQNLRRQRSADDDDSLLFRVRPRNPTPLRGRLASTGIPTSGPTSERPQVRIAWVEHQRRQQPQHQRQRVEVVAHQIPSRSRPLNNKTYGTGSGANRDRSTVLYSRQELAERLRLAWKHREANKANIDIFLAHGTLEERCDSGLSSHTNITASTTLLSPSLQKSGKNSTAFSAGQHEENESSKNENVDGETEEGKKTKEKVDNIEVDGTKLEEKLHEEYLDARSNGGLEDSKKDDWQFRATTLSRTGILADSLKTENEQDLNSAKQKRASFQSCTNRAFFEANLEKSWSAESISQQKNEDGPDDADDGYNQEQNMDMMEVKDALNSDSIYLVARTTFCRKEDDGPMNSVKKNQIANTICSMANSNFEAQENEMREKMLLASALAAKPLTEPKDNSTIEKPDVPAISTTTRLLGNGMQKLDLRTRRTGSAPPQHRPNSSTAGARVRVNIIIDAPSIPSNASSCQNKKPEMNNKLSPVPPQGVVAGPSKAHTGRTIRSAPTRRRSKSAKRRPINSASSSASFGNKEEDEDGKLFRNRSALRGKTSIDTKSSDVVTMVSLVSSADSESDEENSPSDNKLIDELRNKLPSTPIIKTSTSYSSADGVFRSNLRKTTKTVSFHRDSIDEDSSLRTSLVGSATSTISGMVRMTQLTTEATAETVAEGTTDGVAETVPISASSMSNEGEFGVRRLGHINNNRGRRNELETAATTATAGEEASSSDIRWKAELDAGGIVLPTLKIVQEDAGKAVDAHLTDREKRCLAVPIGDVRDKKRKLLGTRSASSRSSTVGVEIPSVETKEQRSQPIISRNDLSVHPRRSIATPNDERSTFKFAAISAMAPNGTEAQYEVTSSGAMTTIMTMATTATTTITTAMTVTATVATTTTIMATTRPTTIISCEPHFQSTKEKECWHLYKRMCNKGVYVSFDTVLRGMLTPTEYRLRHKEFSENF